MKTRRGGTLKVREVTQRNRSRSSRSIWQRTRALAEGITPLKPCPVCDGVVPDPSIHGGRPPIYCGPVCRRTAEQRLARHRAAVTWAKRWLAMTPTSIASMRAIYGAERFATRTEIARDLLAAEESLHREGLEPRAHRRRRAAFRQRSRRWRRA